MIRTIYLLSVIFLVASWTGCSSDSTGGEDKDNNNSPEETESPDEFAEGPNLTGEDVFSKKFRGGNTYTCATCHSIGEDADSWQRVGHPLDDAFLRPSFKNGELGTLQEAVNNCVEHWMVADPLTAEDDKWVALEGWLEEKSAGAAAETLTYTIANPPADVTGGDTTAGMTFFNQSCASCHGADGVGTDKGPAVSGTELTPEKIAERIRLSGPTDSGVYDGLTGGRMPFWSAERLTDDQLKDLIAFLEATETIEPMEEGGNDISIAGAQSDCGTSHPDVGKTATLSTRSHRVAGEVKVVDDCTLEISNFVYDGGGIDVRVYRGVDGAFRSGAAVSSDIFGTSYDGDTVTIRLPTGVTLDDLNSISVWCVAVGVDFGSATW